MGRAITLAMVTLVVAALPPALLDGAAGVSPRWRLAVEGWGVPATDGSRVYVLTKRHELVAADAVSGAVRWRASTGEGGDTTMGAAVVVSRGVVAVGDYDLFGFDSATGARKWRFAPGDGYGVGIYVGGSLGAVVYAGSASGRIYAVAVRSGELLWSALLERATGTTIFQPVPDDDIVAAGYSTFGAVAAGGLVVVERATGEVRWRREFPRGGGSRSAGFAGGPIVAGRLVIAASGDGRIHAFDRASGVARWSVAPVGRTGGPDEEQDWRALAVSGRMMVAGSVSGVLTGYDVRTGQERWRYGHTNGGSIGTRIMADGRRVYVPHFGGLLVAVDSRDGREQWVTGGFSDGFSWPPAVFGGYVYAAGSRGGLLAFRR